MAAPADKTAMQQLDCVTAALGIAVGGFATWLWREIHLRSGHDDFWHRFARVAQCAVSDDDANDFLKSYLNLLTRLPVYVGKRLFALVVALMPIVLLVTFLGPYAIEQRNGRARYIEVFPKQQVAVRLNDQSLNLDRNHGLIPLRNDPNVAATFTTDYCVLHSDSLAKKFAASSSAIDHLLFKALGFDVQRIRATQASGKQLLVVRLSCGDSNVLWPYLNDLEFTFFVAVTLGSLVGWPFSTLVGWPLSRVTAK